ncbi:MAG: hypothetical protein FJ137_22430, partial [Deltaproteobacteria bacterium]|nr:hypothetical protein [Deltaproteobacteria bacterium]
MALAAELLGGLGAERQRDGTWRIDLRLLRLTSLFGGQLQGEGSLTVRGDDMSFTRPAELAVCAGFSLRAVDDADALRELIADLHGDMRARANAQLGSLRRLGFKPALTAPVPRPRAEVTLAGNVVTVSVNGSGQLVVDAIDGQDVPDGQGLVASAQTLTGADVMQRTRVLVESLAKREPTSISGGTLSKADLDALKNVLGDDDLEDDDLDDDDERDGAGGGGAFDDAGNDDADDGDDEYEPTVAGVPPPQRFARPPDHHEAWDAGTVPVLPAAARVTDERRDPATIEVEAGDVLRSGRPSATASARESATVPAQVPVVPAPPPPRSSELLDEFDDEEDTVHGAGDTLAADASDDGFDLLDDSDAVLESEEPSDSVADEGGADDDGEDATPDRHAAARAHPAPTRTPAPPLLRTPDEAEDDLLAVLGGHEHVAAADEAFRERPTTISVTPREARDLVSSPPAFPVSPAPGPPKASGPRPLTTTLADIANGFDDGVGSPLRQQALRSSAKASAAQHAPPTSAARTVSPPPVVADELEDEEDLDGAKTRALAVDAALLERLRRNDGEAGHAEPRDAQSVVSAPPTPIASAEDASPSGDDAARGKETAGGGSAGPAADELEDVASGFDDQGVSTRLFHGAELSSVVAQPPPIAAEAAEADEEAGDEVLAALIVRAARLRAELADVEAEIAERSAARGDTAPKTAPAAPLARPARGPQAPTATWAAIAAPRPAPPPAAPPAP